MLLLILNVGCLLSSEHDAIRLPCLMSKRPAFLPPPADEVLSRHIDAKLLECPGAQVAVVWSLHGGIRIVPLRIGFNIIDRKPHNLSEQLAHLILGVLVLARKLQDPGE